MLESFVLVSDNLSRRLYLTRLPPTLIDAYMYTCMYYSGSHLTRLRWCPWFPSTYAALPAGSASVGHLLHNRD